MTPVEISDDTMAGVYLIDFKALSIQVCMEIRDKRRSVGSHIVKIAISRKQQRAVGAASERLLKINCPAKESYTNSWFSYPILRKKAKAKAYEQLCLFLLNEIGGHAKDI